DHLRMKTEGFCCRSRAGIPSGRALPIRRWRPFPPSGGSFTTLPRWKRTSVGRQLKNSNASCTTDQVVHDYDSHQRNGKLMTNTQLVSKLWNYCNLLRDDGLSYGDYLEQLTYLLFLKMADEQSRIHKRPSI